jgi:hypothetical protein
MGAQAMNRGTSGTAALLLLAFCAGLMTHMLYERWTSGISEPAILPVEAPLLTSPTPEASSFRVTFVPSPPKAVPDANSAELTPIVARDVEKIRLHVGQQARIRGRVFRVGHSAKSNTYFINFGPTKEALTAVIFNSAVELFEKNKQLPTQFENREVEVFGLVKDHPQYGLEIILEDPRQIKILN